MGLINKCNVLFSTGLCTPLLHCRKTNKCIPVHSAGPCWHHWEPTGVLSLNTQGQTGQWLILLCLRTLCL